MRPVFAGLVAGVLVLTALPALDYALAAREVGQTTLSLRVGVNRAGPDTLVAEVGWPASGSGVDSLTVSVTALRGGWLTLRLPASAVSAVFRQGLPVVDGTYMVEAQACRYRRARVNCATPAYVELVIVDTPPPIPERTIR
jgi:hypothetical protein